MRSGVGDGGGEVGLGLDIMAIATRDGLRFVVCGGLWLDLVSRFIFEHTFCSLGR